MNNNMMTLQDLIFELCFDHERYGGELHNLEQYLLDNNYHATFNYYKNENELIITLPRRTVIQDGLLNQLILVRESLKRYFSEVDLQIKGRRIKIIAYNWLGNDEDEEFIVI